MKILHVLDHSLPLQSGYSFRSQNIFKAQRKKGWEPVAITSPKQEENWKHPSPKEEEIEGVRYYRTGGIVKSAIPFKPEISLMLALCKRIREVIKIEKPDILHAHSPVLTALPALRIGRKLGIPVMYEIRAFWEDAASDHGTYTEGSWKYRLTKSIETWVCQRADQVGVLCTGLKNDLISRGIQPEKLSVIYNGINADEFKICEPDAEFKQKWNLQGKKIIGFIGSFYHYEGLDLLLRAFARLT